MPQTITEKILAAHCGKEEVKPGELVNCKLDLIMGHDLTATPAIDLLREKGLNKVFDPEKVVIVQDHFVPNKDIKSAEIVKKLREWVKEQGIKNFYEIGRHGVCHALLPEQGWIKPSMLVIGADSHTCTYGALGAFATGIGATDLAAALATGELYFKVPPTIKFEVNNKLQKGVYSKDIIIDIITRIGVDGALYKAMEFSGKTIDDLSVEARMTITNMAIEAGGKNGIMEADDKTVDFVKNAMKKYGRKESKIEITKSDKNANYEKVIEIDAGSLEPMVAFPPLPGNGKKISDVGEVKIDQAYLGSCTNARIEDLRIAAKVLKGNKVANDVRMLVVPATTEIWKQALKEGLFEIFAEAEASISLPTCGACLGGFMGILASGERCISSTNRNFVGRMGSPKSEVYLASPATVAASAIEGKIADPRKYL